MKIAVLLSGGVDSSVALAFLKEQGHDVSAFYLKIWLEDESAHLSNCPWQEDLSYAQATCKQLKVPLKIISLQKEYQQRVVQTTIAAAKAGKTPNPDVLCNEQIKFGIFYDKISTTFEKVATGHYAQIEEHEGRFILHRSPDQIKDQTYFLCTLSQQQLKRALFPIGHLTKAHVRMHAHKKNLPAKDRKDSQGICFLGKFKFTDFLCNHLSTLPGDIVSFETGKKIGRHAGHWFYTIGQRSGIRLSGGPWYIVKKAPAANIIYVSNQYATIEKPRTEFTVEKLRWLAGKKPAMQNMLVKIRHRSTPKQCTLAFKDASNAIVKLTTKDQGIAPGQHAVFYDNDVCLGSGIIH